MRNLARDVVDNVRLRDTMCRERAEPGTDGTKVAKEGTVERRERTTRERELGCAVVWEEGVGVLEEGDEDQPVVRPEVRDEVDTNHLADPTSV